MNCGFANAIIEQHVELQMLSTTNSHKIGDIQAFDKNKHRIWSILPNLELSCARSILWIDGNHTKQKGKLHLK